MYSFKQPPTMEVVKSKESWLATAAEFIATFLFIFVGCGAVVSSGLLMGDEPQSLSRVLIIAIAHGLAIGVLVATFGSISGGHINPAVTLAMVTARQMPLLKGVMYIIAQFSGAILAAGLLDALLPNHIQGNLGAHRINSNISDLSGFVFEIVLTYALVLVIFGTAVHSEGPVQIAPLAIGFTVLADHLVGVPLTGASMNPARSLGPAVWSDTWAGFWVYTTAPYIGGVLAAYTYHFMFINFPKKPSPAQPLDIHLNNNNLGDHGKTAGSPIGYGLPHEGLVSQV